MNVQSCVSASFFGPPERETVTVNSGESAKGVCSKRPDVTGDTHANHHCCTTQAKPVPIAAASSASQIPCSLRYSRFSIAHFSFFDVKKPAKAGIGGLDAT